MTSTKVSKRNINRLQDTDKAKNIKQSLKELMRKDFVKQYGTWRKNKERFIIVMDANKPMMDGHLRRMVEKEV